MGKRAKAHRKKVANRNQQIKNNQKAFERAFLAAREAAMAYQPSPSNFTALTDPQPYDPNREIFI